MINIFDEDLRNLYKEFFAIMYSLVLSIFLKMKESLKGLDTTFLSVRWPLLDLLSRVFSVVC